MSLAPLRLAVMPWTGMAAGATPSAQGASRTGDPKRCVQNAAGLRGRRVGVQRLRARPRFGFGSFPFVSPLSLPRLRASPRMSSLPFKRVMLKLSGEALMGGRDYGLDPDTLRPVAEDIKRTHDLGIEVCVVVGAGNIFRGVSGAAKGMDRAIADNIGMLGTVINAMALQNAIEQVGLESRVQSAIPIPTVCEPFIRRRAMRHLEKGRIVIFAAGTGNPFFTTDTGAALRASETMCDALLKGTSVDGVYDSDPKLNPDASRYQRLSYHDVLSQDLRVMDASAISLMRESNIPILVFSIRQPGAFSQVAAGQGRFTIICDEDYNYVGGSE